jgi:Uma2 family endonuclease
MRWSVEKYEALAEEGRLPKNVELIRGVVIEKMPKSPLHWAVLRRLHDLIRDALPPGFILRSEVGLRLADSVPEPDLAVVHATEEELLKGHPSTAQLVIEVAVSTAALDRANAALYAEAEVAEYWIVLARERVIEVYTEPVAGAYTERREVGIGELLTCASVPRLSLTVADVFPPLA